MIKLWRADHPADLRALEWQPDRVCAMAFRPDGKPLVAGRGDASGGRYDVATGRTITLN